MSESKPYPEEIVNIAFAMSDISKISKPFNRTIETYEQIDKIWLAIRKQQFNPQSKTMLEEIKSNTLPFCNQTKDFENNWSIIFENLKKINLCGEAV